MHIHLPHAAENTSVLYLMLNALWAAADETTIVVELGEIALFFVLHKHDLQRRS
jgi:hypothetical protein